MTPSDPPAGAGAPPGARTPGAGRGRPSPTAARMMVGAGALAAVTVIGAGLVRFPLSTDAAAPAPPEPKVERVRQKVDRPVQYVRLKPGQKAPKGARVIREAAPTPRIVVQRVSPPTVSSPSSRSSVRVVTRTRQSG